MTWSTGQAWRVVRSLDRLNAQIRAAYPQAVPPATPVTSWGAIANDAHSSTSDHYPHYYSALGKTAVVCARDFPHAPALGLDAHALADRLRTSRDPRIGYIISNRRITGPNHNWRWDPYTQKDPHDTHIHVSTVHTAAADDTRDWQIGDDMTPAEFLTILRDPRVAAEMSRLPWAFRPADHPVGTTAHAIVLNGHTATLGALRADLAGLAGREPATAQEIAAEMLRVLTPQAIADVIPAELAKDVADELARRMVS